MSLTRLFLLVTGGLLVAIGIAFLVAPGAMIGVMDLAVDTPVAAIEIRGFYGGQMVGLGAFVLLGALRPGFAVAALLLLAASLGGTALGRLVGVLAAGTFPAAITWALALEIGGTVAALLLLPRARAGVGR
jgi:hypothetical protein